MNKTQKTAVDAVVLSCQLIDRLRRETGKDWADLLILYTFYARTARYQKTNQPWVLNKFVAKGLYWGVKQVKARKSRLVELGLIENICGRDETGREAKWFVKVNYLWKQSTSIPEIPIEDPSTSIFSYPVPSDQQMLKVQKDKCLKSEEKKKGKGKNPPTLKSQEDTHEEEKKDLPHEEEKKDIPREKEKEPSGCVSCSPGFLAGTPATPPPRSVAPPAPKMSKAEYVQEMGGLWQELVGIDGKHILEADIASNPKVSDWDRQLDYWRKRVSMDEGLDAWKLIARYLAKFFKARGYYPNTHSFLKHWQANKEWLIEKPKIKKLYISPDASEMFEAYIDAQTTDTVEYGAAYLLSARSYGLWLAKQNRSGSGTSSSDTTDWDNHGVGDPNEEKRFAMAMQEDKNNHNQDVLNRAIALMSDPRISLDKRAVLKSRMDALPPKTDDCYGHHVYNDLEPYVRDLERQLKAADPVSLETVPFVEPIRNTPQKAEVITTVNPIIIPAVKPLVVPAVKTESVEDQLARLKSKITHLHDDDTPVSSPTVKPIIITGSDILNTPPKQGLRVDWGSTAQASG